MTDEPNIELRCSIFSFFACFLVKKDEVLFGETLFSPFRTSVSPDRTFSKSNAPNQTRHPVQRLTSQMQELQGQMNSMND